MSGIEKETDLIIKDYAKLDIDQTKLIINALSYEEILDEDVICQVLGYANPNENGSILGWHILMKTSLSESEVDLVVKKAESWKKVMNADEQFFYDVLGEEKSRALREDLRKMKISFNL